MCLDSQCMRVSNRRKLPAPASCTCLSRTNVLLVVMPCSPLGTTIRKNDLSPGTRGEPTGDRRAISQSSTSILQTLILPMISGRYEEEKRYNMTGAVYVLSMPHIMSHNTLMKGQYYGCLFNETNNKANISICLHCYSVSFYGLLRKRRQRNTNVNCNRL